MGDLEGWIQPDFRFSSMKASSSVCLFGESRYTLVEDAFALNSSSMA
jgi:hypothetical protein